MASSCCSLNVTPTTILDEIITLSGETEIPKDNPQRALKNKGIVDSGCSRHMTGNKAYLAKYQDYNGGPDAFWRYKGYITGKGKIKTGKLDFEDVCFVKELQHFNLFSVSQMCDKKNKVLFTDTECLVLSSDFKLPDENQVLLRIPRQNNMYSFNIENIVPSRGKGPNWLFDLGYLTDSMKYQPVRSENQANKTAGPKEANHSAVKSSETKNEGKKPNRDTGLKTNEEPVDQEDQAFLEELERLKRQEKEANDAAEALRKDVPVNTDSPSNAFSTVADFTNLESTMNVSPIPTSKIHSIHPTTQILGDPKSVEELLQFKIQKVWILVDFPYGKKEIRTKWVYKNKKDERGVVVRNKASLTDGIEEFLLVGKKMRSVCVSISQVLDPKFPKKVTPKTSHLNAVKRIFRYLKGKPKLGLWYPRVSSFDLEAYSDSDYAAINLDRKSTTGEAEYVAAANCCRQVLWIQNQMLDYGFNFMNTKIYIDNESTICIVKNPVFHSKTKHIEIRHHFIRDAYKKKLIEVLKIHTNDNVGDLLTKAFDVSRFNFLIVNIGMINL
ncbi:hypothetical protein Tco_1285304 [Tanacetum coccineum]